MKGPRNTLLDLNNQLFEQLERLNDTDLQGEELKEELDRSKAVTGIARTVIDNGKLVLDAQKFQHDDRMDAGREVPRILAGEDNEKS